MSQNEEQATGLIELGFARWPYDSFLIYLLPSGRGELYRRGSNVCLGRVERGWDTWTAETDVFGPYVGARVEDVVERLIAVLVSSNVLALTEVPTTVGQ